MPYFLFSRDPGSLSKEDQNASDLVSMGMLPSGEILNGRNRMTLLCDDSGPCNLPFDTAFYLAIADASLRIYNESARPRLADLDTAIAHFEHLTSRRCNNEKTEFDWYQTLAELYQARFRNHTHDGDDLKKSIDLYQQSITLIHVDRGSSPQRRELLSTLAWMYLEYSAVQQVQDVSHVEKAIALFEQALPDGHEQPLKMLVGLGTALLLRFEYWGFVEILDRCISILRQAVNLGTPNPSHRRALSLLLGYSLCRRIHRLDTLTDAEEAMLLLRNRGNSEANAPETERSNLALFGLTLCHRFRLLGHSHDLDEAVSVLARAASFDSNDFGGKAILSDLAGALHTRFSRFGDRRDREAAITALRKAIELCRLDNTLPTGFLGNLASVYLHDFDDDIHDIDEVISLHRRALDLTPEGHWEKYYRWCDLGMALSCRYRKFGRREDFDESHICHQCAAHLLPEGHQFRPKILRFLGRSYLTRFGLSSDKSDLSRAVQALQDAVQVAPEDYPERVFYLCDLGRCFVERFMHYNDIKDIENAMSAFRRGATSSRGCLQARITASMFWGLMVWVHTWILVEQNGRQPILIAEDSDEACRAFSRMMELVSQLVWLGDTISTRHDNLRTISDPIRFAATVISTEFGLPNKALEWLEQGRSVVWRQQLNLRTPVDDLQTVDPALANRLRAASVLLDSASMRKTLAPDVHTRILETVVSEEIGPSHRRLADEWEKLMRQVRVVPGFEKFLQPKELAELRTAAHIGPIVLLNTKSADGGSQCTALVLQENQENVLVIPFQIPADQVAALCRDMSEVLTSSDVHSRLVLQFSFTEPSQKMEKILSSLWGAIVKPVLDALHFQPVSNDRESYPRIIWCPTGPLAFLPIHAAGDYTQVEPGHRLSDYAVSSYTSTVSTLLDALSRDTTHEFNGLLAVAQSSTPGLPPLPHTPDEVARVQASIGQRKMETVQDEAATMGAVREGMQRSSWIHFACHAIQDPNDPLKSAFCLQDGRLELGDIIQKSHPNADFAFLSACQTCTGDAELADEAVHLAAGMQLAGYRSVVATMWSIRDEDGPLMAEEVYAELFKGDRPDSSRAAYALHRAVLKLQERTRPVELDDSWFLRWIPFIHMGV